MKIFTKFRELSERYSTGRNIIFIGIVRWIIKRVRGHELTER